MQREERGRRECRGWSHDGPQQAEHQRDVHDVQSDVEHVKGQRRVPKDTAERVAQLYNRPQTANGTVNSRVVKLKRARDGNRVHDNR